MRETKIGWTPVGAIKVAIRRRLRRLASETT